MYAFLQSSENLFITKKKLQNFINFMVAKLLQEIVSIAF